MLAKQCVINWRCHFDEPANSTPPASPRSVQTPFPFLSFPCLAGNGLLPQQETKLEGNPSHGTVPASLPVPAISGSASAGAVHSLPFFGTREALRRLSTDPTECSSVSPLDGSPRPLKAKHGSRLKITQNHETNGGRTQGPSQILCNLSGDDITKKDPYHR